MLPATSLLSLRCPCLLWAPCRRGGVQLYKSEPRPSPPGPHCPSTQAYKVPAPRASPQETPSAYCSHLLCGDPAGSVGSRWASVRTVCEVHRMKCVASKGNLHRGCISRVLWGSGCGPNYKLLPNPITYGVQPHIHSTLIYNRGERQGS